MKVKYLAAYCFSGTYIITLLTEGYNFSSESYSSIKFIKKVGGRGGGGTGQGDLKTRPGWGSWTEGPGWGSGPARPYPTTHGTKVPAAGHLILHFLPSGFWRGTVQVPEPAPLISTLNI